MRGYYGIAFYEPKYEENIGTAVRSAHCFGADFIAVIGKRYSRQPSDTMATERHIPIYEYDDMEDFLRHVPKGCEVIPVEVDGEDIREFEHPDRAIYLFGGEDRTLPPIPSSKRLRIETSHCLNMSTTASIVLFHRSLTNKQ